MAKSTYRKRFFSSSTFKGRVGYSSDLRNKMAQESEVSGCATNSAKRSLTDPADTWMSGGGIFVEEVVEEPL